MMVYLIGAGPGDAGLLTIKGKDILEKADVIIYDALANTTLLDYGRKDAEYIYVGKRANDHALPQKDINTLLVTKAKEGKVVARLKGGDPYIFGRGGEEAEELLKAGVPFEEVPGISSTIAGPAYAGIPLTHRSFASSVTLITGHEDPTKPDSVHNWDALAASASTLVFVMGMKNLAHISQNLIKAGLAPDTPAALVHWGTTAHHRSLVGSIKSLPHDAKEHGFTNPSVIVVGHVVSLRDKLNWFEQKPLLGKGIVVTRAREQASGLAASLAELGAHVIQFPTIEIHPLDNYDTVDEEIHSLDKYQWLIFTSVNGVKHFWRRLHVHCLDSRCLHGKKIASIGPATGDALRERGIVPDFIPERYVAEGIVEGMLALGMKGQNILIPRAKEAREVLPEALAKAGAHVTLLPVYETKPADSRREEVLHELEKGRIHCITFGSSSTVDNFLSLVPGEVLKAHPHVKLAAIGPVTAQTLYERGLPCHIQPATYTIPSLVHTLKELL